MKKGLGLLVVTLSSVAVLAGCGGKSAGNADTAAAAAAAPATAVSENGEQKDSDLKFAIVFGMGGLGDNGFNDEVFEGCKMASEQFSVPFDYVEPKEISDYETQLRMYADSEEYELIIMMSSDQVDAIQIVAADYPDQKFAHIDTTIEGYDNIHSVSASHPEQHFLSGVLAGIVTQDERFELSNEENILGFAIAMDGPVPRAQAAGFLAGAKYANPDVEIITSYIGSYRDPGKAKEIALSMYDRGADIVSQNAGSSGMGVFAAAKDSNRYVIGTALAMVDPDHSLCTSRKKIELFVIQEIGSLVDGTWEAGSTIKGIKDGVCDYDIENLNTVFPEDVIEKVESVKKLIIEGKLPMPNDLDEIDEWTKLYQMN